MYKYIFSYLPAYYNIYLYVGNIQTRNIYFSVCASVVLKFIHFIRFK